MKHTVKEKTKNYTKQAVFFSGQRRGLLVCVLTAFCFFTGFFSGDENWWYLAVMLAAVIAVSLVLAFLSFALVRLEYQNGSQTILSGSVCRLPYALRCGVPFLFSRVRVYYMTGECDSADGMVRAALCRSCEPSSVIALTPRYKGHYAAGICFFSISDPLGLFTAVRSIKNAKPFELTVLPRICSAEGVHAGASVSETHCLTQGGWETDSTTDQNRKYRFGDALKLVDWKTSARRRELYVKQLQCQSGREVRFFVEQIPKENADARECEELAASELLSCAAALGEEKTVLRVLCGERSWFFDSSELFQQQRSMAEDIFLTAAEDCISGREISMRADIWILYAGAYERNVQAPVFQANTTVFINGKVSSAVREKILLAARACAASVFFFECVEEFYQEGEQAGNV
ncbi:MAG: DUF58 domain-containing protein [Clostridiales bacterium]|nr:DUF58 domain-containing protein [Clostridiales bacterium]